MHETALVRNLLATVEQVILEHNVRKVNRVVISVGKLANVLPDALTFAFEAMTQDGPMKGAELEIRSVPAVARCDDCGYEYQADGFPIICPFCKSNSFRIISGEEVYIDSIEYEE
ncbi:MAG TPA: hydrogenase maturation nickel metallochaperone HypA [Clostridiales bacterium]|nr:hydrogenase maturation nickel metallochaperone HypA [Clostridiales bacterium]HPP34857.1 hydrogenase maturation nickel metallochaperone HypA [Clostridiales bacterium]